jgi:LPS export ABC transporter protein LptC
MSRARPQYRAPGLVSLVLAVTLAFSCHRESAPPPTLSDVLAGRDAARESWDIRFSVSENGLPRVVFEAPYLARYEREDSVFTILRSDSIARPVVAYVFADGDSSATITAREMTLFSDHQLYEARGQVVVLAQGNRRLESEHLVWNENEGMIRTPGFARITTPSERIQGYQLVADENLETYSLARVTGQVTLEED